MGHTFKDQLASCDHTNETLIRIARERLKAQARRAQREIDHAKIQRCIHITMSDLAREPTRR